MDSKSAADLATSLADALEELHRLRRILDRGFDVGDDVVLDPPVSQPPAADAATSAPPELDGQVLRLALRE